MYADRWCGAMIANTDSLPQPLAAEIESDNSGMTPQTRQRRRVINNLDGYLDCTDEGLVQKTNASCTESGVAADLGREMRTYWRQPSGHFG